MISMESYKDPPTIYPLCLVEFDDSFDIEMISLFIMYDSHNMNHQWMRLSKFDPFD